jgi:Tfp pilus assembly protein PilZ
MRENRTSKRVAFQNTAYFSPSPHRPYNHKSFIADLSAVGICIKTNTLYKPGTRLFMVIETADKSYDAEGIVTWVKKVPLRLIQTARYSMGIKFTHVDPELIDLYEKKLKIVA